MNEWEKYYLRTPGRKVPWSGVQEKYFDTLWSKYHLARKGNLFDVGCGRGDKSIFFAKRGFKVWGVDISPTAVKAARRKARVLKNAPTFLISDITKLGQLPELEEIKFDIVLDKLVSQFLSFREKREYLAALSKKVKPGKTFYILQCFGKKDENDKPPRLPKWIQRIAQSPAEVEKVYGKYFDVTFDHCAVLKNGRKLDTYVLRAK